jgi:hypothetical protein
MALLPKKTTPQEWEDIVLPIFEQPEEVPVRQQSKKQQADAKAVQWRRRPRTARQAPCEDCVEEKAKGLREGIEPASYIRNEGRSERWVCHRHHADRVHNEELGKG